MENLNDAIGTFAILIASLMVVAAAAESVLETFRGTLARFGLTFLKSEVS